jgi:predicted phosphodiesterase
MRILCFSDLHFEFGHQIRQPQNHEGDVLILAGDIVTVKNPEPLNHFLKFWNKPVLYVMGNHEYYTHRPMDQENERLKSWLTEHHPNVTLLLDEAVSIDGIHFFGGTMWTDFNKANKKAMLAAEMQMNDFRRIITTDGQLLKPRDTIAFHETFKEKLLAWFTKDLPGPRVVISHHAPVTNPNSQYLNSALMPAFNATDMEKIIIDHQPTLWIYGHTHECDDQQVAQTRVVSNQLGYPDGNGGYECAGFDETGKIVEV